jgi:primosomal protein N' (replication factor Y)
MYPPYQRWVRILLEGKVKKKVKEKSEKIKKELEREGLNVLGPSPCPLSRIKGEYRYHIVLRDEGTCSLEEVVRKINPAVSRSSVKVGVDVDPIFTM